MTADLIHFFTHNWLGQAIVILAQCLAIRAFAVVLRVEPAVYTAIHNWLTG